MPKLALGYQRSARLQQFNDSGIGLEYGFALIFRQGFRETSLIIQGRVSL